MEPVFVFDGGDLTVFESVADAESGTEVYDLDTLRYFDAVGTVFRATADDYRVRLRATADRRPEELHALLDAYLHHPRLALDASLANDPQRLAVLLASRQRSHGRFRWPTWLHRLLHRR